MTTLIKADVRFIRDDGILVSAVGYFDFPESISQLMDMWGSIGTQVCLGFQVHEGDPAPLRFSVTICALPQHLQDQPAVKRYQEWWRNFSEIPLLKWTLEDHRKGGTNGQG